MVAAAGLSQTEASATRGVRLYYLDWLRVIATLGVFLFHVSCVFSSASFEIRNAEGSDTILFIQALFFPWGMPLFFLVSGAGSWFALRRRSAAQFTRERTLRLLVPFATGTILLGPIQLYFSWRHRVETGIFDGTLAEFTAARLTRIGPKLFGAIGYHMWFLGFLFAFSLLALPLFVWLKGEKGRRFISWLAEWCLRRRGGILLFILPLAVVRVGLQPLFPVQQDWADFFSHGSFFVLGFILFADERFAQAIRRDWGILLGAGIVAMLGAMAVIMTQPTLDIEKPAANVSELMMWACIAACGWCWTAFMLYVGQRFLDRTSRGLRYGLSAILPFFVLHQAVILAIAYFVVQWQASIPVKLLVVGLGSFAISLGLYELVIKRVPILRAMFGMKPEPSAAVQMATA